MRGASELSPSYSAAPPAGQGPLYLLVFIRNSRIGLHFALTCLIWLASCGSSIRQNSDTQRRLVGSLTRIIQCAVQRRGSSAGAIPARQLVVPAGSNRSDGGGNESGEASGEEGRLRATWRVCRP